MRTVREILEEGFSHHARGDLQGAVEIYDKLLGYTDGADPNVLYAYGTALAAGERWGLATYMLRMATSGLPGHAPAWTNLAIALKNLDRDEASFAAYAKALELEPDGAEVHTNLSGWWVNRGHPEKVLEHAAKALAVAPDNPQARNHLALGLLEAGRFDEAWPHYAGRWDLPERQKDRRPFTCPKWDGRTRVGTLAIHGEQGLGDEILFLGCLQAVQRRVDSVVIECNKRLVPILERAFSVPCFPDHAALIDGHGEPDAYVAMGDLPMLAGMPDGRPYLPRTRDRHPRRVGIGWRGGSVKTAKKFRSMSLDLPRPLLGVPDVEFVSIQYGPQAAGEAAAAGLRHDLPPGRDLEPIHDAIASCDLIVTVCQTAVHQAGAMGVDCWVLTPFACAWRYSPAFGDAMPWYRSVRLFRQAEEEGWEPVVERVRAALEARYA